MCQIIEVLGLAPPRSPNILRPEFRRTAQGKEGRWAYIAFRRAYADATRPLIEWLRGALQGASTVECDRVMLEAVLALNLCDVARNQRSR